MKKKKKKISLLSKHNKNNHPSSKSMQHHNGTALRQYSKKKKLPASFLTRIGITEKKKNKETILSIPYRDKNGTIVSTRYITNLEGKYRYEWKKGSNPILYGIDRLVKARKKKFIILTESESDCQTLWYHKIPAIGIPCGTSWNEDRYAHYFLRIDKIYLLREQDDGADNTINELIDSSIKDRIEIIRLRKFKNLTEMHLRKPEKFKTIIKNAFESAKSLKDHVKDIRAKQRKNLYAKAKEIAEADNIMHMFAKDIEQKGMVKEKRLVKGLYLSLVTRLLNDPVNVVVKGKSSTGKSQAVDSVLKYFPPEAYYKITSATNKALIYSEESFKHRFIIIYEAVGMQSSNLDYLIRTLISDKQIKHETTKGLITKDGPTGFITTTTSKCLNNDENENRYLSITTDSSPEQTKAVILSKAREVETGSDKKNYDWGNWLAFHKWLAFKKNIFEIPYAVSLAKLINCDDPRRRRDYTHTVNLIGAHAIIHQRNREKNKGFIIANKDDYSVVYKILNKALSSTVATSSSDIEIVSEVKRALEELKVKSISMTKLATRLSVDKGTVSRRIRSPISQGYLVNMETKLGVEAKIALGKPIETKERILPSPKKLWKAYDKKKKKSKK